MNKRAVSVNTRILGSHTTGVQRYLQELMVRWRAEVRAVSPVRYLGGIKGHAWEQLCLPAKLRGGVLFSPSNSGPLAVRRQVVTLHDIVPLDHPEWLNPKFASWYGYLTPRLARRVARVVTISQFSKQRIIDRIGLRDEQVVVVHNGVDERFRPRPSLDISRALSALELPSSRYVLCVGSLEPRKNLGRLLKAWGAVSKSLPDDVWLVVSGAKGKSLVFADEGSAVRLPERVHLTGHVPDDALPCLYAGALSFAYLSVYEGFGLPPLEAMASGVPVLTGNRTALPEVVGDAGLMVNPFEVDDIAQALLRLTTDEGLRSRLREAGLKRAALFDWETAASRTMDVISDVASDS